MDAYKIVIIGNTNSGKTSILNRYVYRKFTVNVPTTIGIEFVHKDMGDETKIVFWDTAGQERYQSLMSSYYRGAHAIMFLYDVADRSSFEDLHKWWREYLSYSCVQECATMLVGNKVDLERQVTKEEALTWAVEHKMCYEEVSSKNDVGVNQAFDVIINQLKKLPSVQKEKIRINSLPESDRCCY